MFAADRSVICLVDEALDLAKKFDAADVVWPWMRFTSGGIRTFVRRSRSAPAVFRISCFGLGGAVAWDLAGRSMMGTGVIELRRIREAIDAAGYW